MQAEITALYAALTAFLFLALAYQVVLQRRRAHVSLGAGDDQGLERAIRAHGNLAENAPIVLLLMLICELNGGAVALLHVAGAAFIIARVLHAQGLTATAGLSKGRFYGVLVTWIVIIALALANLVTAF